MLAYNKQTYTRIHYAGDERIGDDEQYNIDKHNEEISEDKTKDDSSNTKTATWMIQTHVHFRNKYKLQTTY